jgi:hypothetical protein
MPYSILNTVVFGGMASMWDEDDIEMVAAHPAFLDWN